MKTLLGILLLAALVGVPAALYFLSAPLTIDVSSVPKAFGPETNVRLGVSGPHGARTLHVFLEQEKAKAEAGLSEPADRWRFWRKKLAPSIYHVTLKSAAAQGFRSGPAKLTVEAVSNDFRAQTATRTVDVIVDLDPLKLTADAEQHYVNQGGAGVVLFHVSGYWTEAGVRVAGAAFRSYPLPGSKDAGERFSLFVLPWNAPHGSLPVVYARNPGGQEVTAGFHCVIKPKVFRKRDMDLADSFLDKVLGDLDPSGKGEKLERFLKINRDMRVANNTTLASLREQTEPRMLWEPPFLQLSNSKVEAVFADTRRYRYQGRHVDEQTHLGFDLSKTQGAPVAASGAGKVVWADRLGIYGNAVVIDHGYGLQSIYAHLNRIEATKGQPVERGAEIGLTGSTGLAGGDHLHFSMQIDGVQTNPIEWWDPHWIQDNILGHLKAPPAAAAK